MCFNPRPASSAGRTGQFAGVVVYGGVSIHALLHQQGEHQMGEDYGHQTQFQSTPCFISRANAFLPDHDPAFLPVSIHALLHQQGEPLGDAQVALQFGVVSIHALLHQQGERRMTAAEYEAECSFNPRPASSAGRTLAKMIDAFLGDVSIHALLHQQGELALCIRNCAAISVSIHALLHQQGERVCLAQISATVLFQSTPCFISRANSLSGARPRDQRGVSIHALLHQQGEPDQLAALKALSDVSIHALLHQQGEPILELGAFDVEDWFQSTPCFISRANASWSARPAPPSEFQSTPCFISRANF